MSWTATKSAKGVNFKGPAGDTLTFTVTSSVTGMAWNTYSWSGDVKRASTGADVAVFFISNAGTTSNALNLQITLKTTESSKLPVGVECYWSIQGILPVVGDEPIVKEWFGGKITASMDVTTPNA